MCKGKGVTHEGFVEGREDQGGALAEPRPQSLPGAAEVHPEDHARGQACTERERDREVKRCVNVSGFKHCSLRGIK